MKSVLASALRQDAKEFRQGGNADHLFAACIRSAQE